MTPLLLLLVASQQQALPRAHSHNDYERSRPLEQAVELGFGSVEADVFLVNGELLVAHDRDKVDADKTLNRLYLKPIYERFSAGKHVPSILLIDIKKDGAEAWRVLRKQLEPYRKMIGADKVQVVISGDRPKELIFNDIDHLTAYDGRASDLDLPEDARIPLISESWLSHFIWFGTGEMPEVQLSKLREMVGRAHKNKRKIRFWATPDKPAVWEVLHREGVDLIGTDNPEALSEFLRSKTQ